MIAMKTWKTDHITQYEYEQRVAGNARQMALQVNFSRSDPYGPVHAEISSRCLRCDKNFVVGEPVVYWTTGTSDHVEHPECATYGNVDLAWMQSGPNPGLCCGVHRPRR